MLASNALYPPKGSLRIEPRRFAFSKRRSAPLCRPDSTGRVMRTQHVEADSPSPQKVQTGWLCT